MDRVLCPECGVPLHITAEHAWQNNGTIVQSKHRGHRMVFVESDIFDPLFRGIGNLIGPPIERIVINVSRRATRSYMDRLLTDEARELVQDMKLGPEVLAEPIFMVGGVMGYGKGSLVDVRYEQQDYDFVTVRFENPYSIPIMAGNILGTLELVMARAGGVTYKQVPPNTLEVTVFPAEHPADLKDRFFFRQSKPKGGGIDLTKCKTCGGPAALSDFKWDLENGIIRSESSGKRIAMIGAAMVDPIFEELGNEVGKDIPEVVIEAQRRFVRSGYYSVSEVRGEPKMREIIALRGTGELLELKMGRKGVQLRIANAALPLLGVGLTQGLYELAFGIESKVEWSLSKDGMLEVSVTPWD